MKNFIGLRFGLLTVISDTGKKGRQNHRIFLCKCECGNLKEFTTQRLLNTESCGCLRNKAALKRYYGFDLPVKKTKIWRTWRAMKTRCYNPNQKQWCNYGGKGIIVCDEWRNDFLAFRKWAIENGYEDRDVAFGKKLSIDRIDSNGNYEPSNCRWITFQENSRLAANDRWNKKRKDG